MYSAWAKSVVPVLEILAMSMSEEEVDEVDDDEDPLDARVDAVEAATVDEELEIIEETIPTV